MKNIKVALIGFGGIARFHNAAYKKIMEKSDKLTLVAVCDKNIEQFTKSITINIGGGDSRLPEGIHTYTDIDEMIEKEDFDMADICLPTFLHKDFTIKLLNAGKHVLCEKPMALNSADAQEMLDTANAKGLRLMIGLDLHFDPNYKMLHEVMASGELGAIEHLEMWRYSTYPNWGAGDHFANINKSGGITMDMHIHDIDIVRHTFGIPNGVDCTIYDRSPHVQAVTSQLYYYNFTAIVKASWDETRTITFTSGYDAKFEKGSLILRDSDLTVYHYGKEPQKFNPYAAASTDLYEEEIAYFASLVRNPEKENKINPPECTLTSTEIIEKLRESAKTKPQNI